MTNFTADTSLKKVARVAGFMFLFSLILPLIYGGFIFPTLTVAGDVIATANKIISNELLFRIGIITELVWSVGAAIFALVLYIILKPVNRNLAQLAVFLKLMEAVLLAVVTLGHFIALLILKAQSLLVSFESGPVQALTGIFISLNFNLGTFTMIFHGLNMTIFMYLLFVSKYIPKLLAGFGILSYTLIFLYAVIAILLPNYASMQVIQIVFMTPSVLTELTIGLWLVFKSVNIQQEYK